jgi:hypothetical protein
MPKVNNNPSIHDLVIQDIQDRKDFGYNKYGTILQSGNGRKSAVDLHQELLDAVCYSRALIDEQNATIKALLLMVRNHLSVSSCGAIVYIYPASTQDKNTLSLLNNFGYLCKIEYAPAYWTFTEKAASLMEQD